jgi:electron transfer flavoprotein beta subunit
MFNIVVCFKIVDDIDEILADDWENLGCGAPDTSYVRRMIGCYDEAALENALALKDDMNAKDTEACVTAVTINPGYSEHLLANFPAIGIDRTLCFESGSELRFSPETTAFLLADAIAKEGPFDIIVTGGRTPPAGSGMVPLLLAERLACPCVTEAKCLVPVAEGIAVAHEQLLGICTRTVTEPFVCTIGNADRSYLRIPTLREKKRADKTTIKHRDIRTDASRGIAFSSSSALKELIRETNTRTCVFAPGQSAAEKAKLIYDDYLRRMSP